MKHISPLQELRIREQIPSSMVGGLIRYVDEGVQPGGFWLAVLKNDLADACARADENNKYLIYDFVYVLYNYCPSECWGSPEKVDRWINLYKEAKEPL